jgi:hypothetical protein
VRGQTYLLIGTEPHTRRDGSKTKLAIPLKLIEGEVIEAEPEVATQDSEETPETT